MNVKKVSIVIMLLFLHNHSLYPMERNNPQGLGDPEGILITLLKNCARAERVFVPLYFALGIGLVGRYITCTNTELMRRFWNNFKDDSLAKKLFASLTSLVMIPLDEDISQEHIQEVMTIVGDINEKMGWNIGPLYIFNEPTTSARCDSITEDTFAFSPDFFTKYSKEERAFSIAYLCSTIKEKSDHRKITEAAIGSAVIGFIIAMILSLNIGEAISSPFSKEITLPGLYTFITALVFTNYVRKIEARSYRNAARATDTFESTFLELSQKLEHKNIFKKIIYYIHSILHSFFGIHASTSELLSEFEEWKHNKKENRSITTF